VLDVRSANLTYASAGHNLALCAPAGGGEVRPMLTGGIPLGVVAPADIEQKVLSLAPGDVVLFYTDGLTDSLNQEGEAFGDERLGCVLGDRRERTAEEIADSIDVAVRDFVAGAPRYDDLTLIVLKRNPVS
jgi:serine phosphatase RsbU (regulator of sigma subunit)